MMNPTIERAAHGEREAMAQLVADHYPVVFRFCARRLGQDLAQDAAQDTFITAQHRLRKFEERSTFQTWLLGIANNHCRNLARKHRFEISYRDIWHQGQDAGESQLVDREMLRKAILALSVEHREAVVMHEIEGLSYDEIAAILKVPNGTVKSRLFHAFRMLRRTLTPSQEVTV